MTPYLSGLSAKCTCQLICIVDIWKPFITHFITIAKYPTHL